LQGCPFTGRLEASADASPADRITFLDRQMIADMVQQAGTDNDIPTARYYIADSDSKCIESKLQRQPDHRAGFSLLYVQVAIVNIPEAHVSDIIKPLASGDR